jgi:hypothetical protein
MFLPLFVHICPRLRKYSLQEPTEENNDHSMGENQRSTDFLSGEQERQLVESPSYMLKIHSAQH